MNEPKEKQQPESEQFQPDQQSIQFTYGPPSGQQAPVSGFMGLMSRMGQQSILPEGAWLCTCGTLSTGNFCPECGRAKPNP